MSNNRRLGSNIAYNIILQVAILVLPFIVTPYISRVLTPDGTGIYSFTNSIVSYFTLFASFGLSTFGTRQIAFVRDNKEKLDETFSSLVWFKAFTSFVALVVYLIFLQFMPERYKVCLTIQILLIISAAIDISWLYFGLEEFKSTVLRSLLIKTLVIVSTFIFVKGKEDLWVYVLITSVGNLLGNLILWGGLKTRTRLVKVSFASILNISKPAAVVFISFIAIEVYTVLDKTMLGVMTTDSEVGLYTYGEQFAKASLGVIGAISTALLPHMSNMKESGSVEAFDRKFNQMLLLVSMIGVAASFGMMGIAREFIPWMLGADYSGSIIPLIFLSPLAIIISTSNIISKTYLLPSKREKICNYAVVCGACVNLIMNCVFIPKFQVIGACIGTLIAEVIVTIIHFYGAYKAIDFRSYLLNMMKYLVSGLIMLFIVNGIGKVLKAGFVTTIVQVLVGAIVYIIMLILLRSELLVYLSNLVHIKLKNRS